MKAGFLHFVEHVLGVAYLSRAQRVYCRVVFDRVQPHQIEGKDREIARRLFGEVDTIPDAAFLALFALKGARIGGTWLHSLHLLYSALTHPLRGLALGERAYAVIVAPDLRLARQGLSYIKGAVQHVPEIRQAVEGETNDSITIRRPHDGQLVTIECLPATRGGTATRARSYVAALVDEACFLRDEQTGQVNDAEIFRSLSARMLPGAVLSVISTVFTEAGLLWDRVKAHHGKPETCLCAIAPTLVMRNDERIQQVVADEYARDPENAAREFDCKPHHWRVEPTRPSRCGRSGGARSIRITARGLHAPRDGHRPCDPPGLQRGDGRAPRAGEAGRFAPR